MHPNTEVKDDCRNDPKTSRSILVAIAGMKTPTKMKNLYLKYKKSGLTRGELRTQSAKPKPADAPTDPIFVDQFYKRLGAADFTTLSVEQLTALKSTLAKLTELIEQRVKSLP